MNLSTEEILFLFLINIGIGVTISSLCFSLMELRSFKVESRNLIHIIGIPICVLGIALLTYAQYTMGLSSYFNLLFNDYFSEGIKPISYILIILLILSSFILFQRKLNIFFANIRNSKKINIKVVYILKILPLSLLTGCLFFLSFIMSLTLVYLVF